MRDKGLQPERTALAWSRTVLTWCACLALLFRSAWLSSEHSVLLTVYFLGACAIPATLMCVKRASYLKRTHPPRQVSPMVPLALSSMCAVGAMLAIWSVLG